MGQFQRCGRNTPFVLRLLALTGNGYELLWFSGNINNNNWSFLTLRLVFNIHHFVITNKIKKSKLKKKRITKKKQIKNTLHVIVIFLLLHFFCNINNCCSGISCHWDGCSISITYCCSIPSIHQSVAALALRSISQE
jgi:hypothetical protein